MKEFQIPCTWTMHAMIRVPADSLDQALNKVLDSEECLPEGRYLEDSFEVNKEEAKMLNSHLDLQKYQIHVSGNLIGVYPTDSLQEAVRLCQQEHPWILKEDILVLRQNDITQVAYWGNNQWVWGDPLQML